MTNIYAAPAIDVVGQMHSLTLGLGDGDHLDATFPTKTPKKDLTFS